MSVRALHTPTKLSIGLCALWLAATGCDDSSTQVVTDAGTDAGPDNANGGSGMNGDDDGDDNGDDSGGNSGGDNGGFIGGDNGMMPVAMLDDDVAGKACSSDSDCAGQNATCSDTIGGISIFGMNLGGQPAEGGYCSGACESDSDCGQGGVCAGGFMTPLGNLPGNCQKACESDSECRTEEGYGCVESAAAPGGGMGMAPPAPSTCLPVPATVELDDGVVGKPCSADSDCTGGVCVTTLTSGAGAMTEFPEGYCGGKCLEDSDCGGTGACVGVFTGFGGLTPGDCYQACESESDCTREGYSCAATQGAMGAGPSVCQPGETGDGGASVIDAGALDAGTGASDGGVVAPTDASVVGATDAGANEAGASEPTDAGATSPMDASVLDASRPDSDAAILGSIDAGQ